MGTVACRKCGKPATLRAGAGPRVARASCPCEVRWWLPRREHNRVRPKVEEVSPLTKGARPREGSSSWAQGSLVIVMSSGVMEGDLLRAPGCIGDRDTRSGPGAHAFAPCPPEPLARASGSQSMGCAVSPRSAVCGLETWGKGIDAMKARARWMSLCIRWVAWRQRRSGRREPPFVDPSGAERRAARLLRHWHWSSRTRGAA